MLCDGWRAAGRRLHGAERELRGRSSRRSSRPWQSPSTSQLSVSLSFYCSLQVEKAEKREETVAVAVVQLAPPGASPADLPATHFLLVQRPPAGLLAGLWQFPLLQLASEAAESTVRVRGGLLGGGGGALCNDSWSGRGR